MKINIINELNKDEKMHEYLLNHSNWFRIINRNSNNFKNFLDEYKKYKRDENINKAEEMIDNFELISNVVKMMQ